MITASQAEIRQEGDVWIRLLLLVRSVRVDLPDEQARRRGKGTQITTIRLLLVLSVLADQLEPTPMP